MARERVTGFPAVPTTLALLMGLRSFSRYDLRSLRYITNAAAPLPLNRISALREAFPNVEFFSMYGQTECKRACYLPPEDLEERPGSVGIPIPGTGVMVVDRQGHPVARGTVGELVVMGPHVMRGYWGKPLETAQRLRPSPVTGEKILYTGDLFRMDDDGYLYFVSRADDIIKTRGEKVSPTEVEMGLYPLPGVREVAATGVPDPILGEAIAVFISREEGATLTARDVRAYCARHLEDVMIPTYVEFCDELPRSDTGKVLRRRLLQMTREEEHADAGH
jgi:acyl-CoA synthetase (AMP-forming)/AMP-acid ligase II